MGAILLHRIAQVPRVRAEGPKGHNYGVEECVTPPELLGVKFHAELC